MDLGFERIALDAFQFLQSEYGFRCIESNQWHVRYESEHVFVSVNFDGNRSFEVGCSVGRLDNFMGSSQVAFSLGELLRSEGKGNADSSFQVTTSETLEKFTNVLSEKLRSVGKSVLSGDDRSFERLAQLRSQESIAYAKSKELEQVRRSVETAWKGQEYQKVVELLAPVQEWLTPSEVKKLEFARRQL